MMNVWALCPRPPPPNAKLNTTKSQHLCTHTHILKGPQKPQRPPLNPLLVLTFTVLGVGRDSEYLFFVAFQL